MMTDTVMEMKLRGSLRLSFPLRLVTEQYDNIM